VETTGESPILEHLNMELEWGDNGYVTGNYHCIVCDKAVARQKPDSSYPKPKDQWPGR